MNRDLRILLVLCGDTGEGKGFDSLAVLPCRTLRPAGSMGYGAAVQEGATLAAELGYDAIITMAGDGRHDPADVRLLIEEARSQEGPCLVIGSPPAPPASADFWLRLECGLELADPASCFRLYPVKELLALQLNPQHSLFAIESLVRFAWSGLPVVPVTVAVADPPAAANLGLFGRMTEKLGLVLLHGRLVTRRLLPLPHQRFVPEESLHKKVVETISQNPFRVLGRICREHSSPLWLAMAVWLGIFMGALPLLSIHTIAIIYVAHRLHVNKFAAVAASQFCMPPVVPVLCIQVGYYLRKGELLLDFSWQRWLLEIHVRFWEWLIGSLILGPLLGFLGAGVMYWVVARLQKKIASTAG